MVLIAMYWTKHGRLNTPIGWTARLPAAMVAPPFVLRCHLQPRCRAMSNDQGSLEDFKNYGSPASDSSIKDENQSALSPATESDSLEDITDYLSARLRPHQVEAGLNLEQPLKFRLNMNGGSLKFKLNMHGVNRFRKRPVSISIENDIKPVLEYLESIPGVNLVKTLQDTHNEIPLARWFKPGSLGRLRLRVVWLEETLDLGPGNLGKIMNRNGDLITSQDVPAKAIQTLQGIGLKIPQISVMIVKESFFLRLSQKKLESMMATFKSHGMTEAQIQSAICKHPAILNCTPERVQKHLSWAESHGLTKEQLPSLITKLPAFFSYDLQENLDKKIEFLKTELDFDEQHIARVMRSIPSLLGCKTDTLTARIQYMRDLGLTDNQIKKCCKSFPTALALNLSSPNQQLKFKFFKEELDIVDLAALLTTDFRCIAYSMKRLALRTAYLKSLYKVPDHNMNWLRPKDANFVSVYAKTTVEDFKFFEAEWIESDAAKLWLSEDKS